jgi:GNAT superfamily N-acetyltransferase
MSDPIIYRRDIPLDRSAFVGLYRNSTLGERRPIDDPAIVEDMIANANLTITAWQGSLLVGIARTMTDFSYVGYLADLAVRQDMQRSGIGVKLIEHTRAALGPRAMLVLLAAPGAVDYYPRIGFEPYDSAWLLRAGNPLGSPRAAAGPPDQ